MIRSLLVANRGEIAVRVARTARDLGIATVAVFTAADAGALHVEACDSAIRIPSYLDVDAVVAAAIRADATAVHPGYGFLSENAAFARAVVAAGLTWVGPPPAAIEVMGDKARAKALARGAGVPVVPGVEGDDTGVQQIERLASEHGLPLVIKAVAGGGGKGMRVVRDLAELPGALDAARREALAAFGDDRVLAERYLERPRHIEVQVLADAHGTVLHLGERECSLQRRHQKVVEEAPSPVIDAAARARLGDSAVALARACGYVGAGTVEFVATGDGGELFFLEMNTRLQVEHPVTELVYGVDLVAEQLRVAAGEPLTLDQSALVPEGHAIEARLYAEDPAAGFLPATGTIAAYREPAGAGVRVDSGVRAGSEVGTAYDPMLAKVIAHGPDRATALARLDRALADLRLLGVATNAAFTRMLLGRDDVRAGAIDTGLLERVLAEWEYTPPDDLLPAAVWAAHRADTRTLTGPPGPWRRPLAGHGEARVVSHGGANAPGHGGANVGATVTVGERSWQVRGRDADGGARIEVDGVERHYAVAMDADAVLVGRDGHQLEIRTAVPERAAAALAGSLEAPMPGTVLLVHAANGDAVQEGDVLLVLESMKMELQITAPHAGTVAGLELVPGDQVARHQPLVAVTVP